MNLKTILGWLLIVAGIVVITWTLYYSYQVFTGKLVAPLFFVEEKGGKIKFDTNADKTPSNINELPKDVGVLIGDQLKNILPTDAVIRILNLVVWSMLAWILISGGGQLSSLGIKMLN